MSRIGIIGAMEQEVIKIKEEKMELQKVTRKASMDFYEGKLSGKEVVIVRSGIGKVNAAICAQILVDDFNVSCIINTGVAGSLKNEINIGDIVLSRDTLQHDMDATGFGYQLGEIPQMDCSVFAGDSKMIETAKQVCERVNQDIQVFIGRVVSGDQFVSDPEKKHYLVDRFDGFCTEMEGAAIGQAAYLNHVPFLVIRAISDKADDSAEMDYSQFEEQAIRHTIRLLEEFVKYL